MPETQIVQRLHNVQRARDNPPSLATMARLRTTSNANALQRGYMW